ncbi:hypothetical protein GW766_02010 [Candidatus Parcubacteria bacterium]|nr:hypothetical protein [Candidatus Parcubacteria bacterium]
MSVTTDWSTKYDRLIFTAICSGQVTGALSGVPDKVIESGLAHIFFYGDTVYKLYKTHDDKGHFIRGVLAPTDQRTAFMRHDFSLNKHFSDSIYQEMYSVYFRQGRVEVLPFDETSIYTLIKMDRLDFDTNLHERLLRDEVDAECLFLLGYETAHAVDTCPITIPDTVNWYDLANERVTFLRQFTAWLPIEFATTVQASNILELLDTHLSKYRDEYLSLKGEALTVNIDNHDENVFFKNGKPQFIDLLPPMSCWWFGLPYANLSNLMVNVETLHSVALAKHIERGYFKYFAITSLPKHTYGFTHAFAHMISIAHFGSVPGKEAVTRQYIQRLPEVKRWVQ